jgi:hypothetical protein
MRAIREIGSSYTLAVGTALQVYRSVDWYSWEAESVPLLAGEEVTDAGLEAVSAFSAEDVYAAGWEGLLCHRDGKGWRRVDSPTNLDLYDVHCAADGFVYAVGDEGTVLKGRGSAWSVVEQSETADKLWGVSELAGRIFVSSMHVIYELLDGQLVPVTTPEDEVAPSSIYRLTAAKEVLWSAGTKELYEYNGSVWTPLLSFFD